MYITPLQVFGDAGFKSLVIAEFNNANRRSLETCNLSGPEAPGSRNNLEMPVDLAHNQGSEDRLCPDALGQLIECRII